MRILFVFLAVLAVAFASDAWVGSGKGVWIGGGKGLWIGAGKGLGLQDRCLNTLQYRRLLMLQKLPDVVPNFATCLRGSFEVALGLDATFDSNHMVHPTSPALRPDMLVQESDEDEDELEDQEIGNDNDGDDDGVILVDYNADMDTPSDAMKPEEPDMFIDVSDDDSDSDSADADEDEAEEYDHENDGEKSSALETSDSRLWGRKKRRNRRNRRRIGLKAWGSWRGRRQPRPIRCNGGRPRCGRALRKRFPGWRFKLRALSGRMKIAWGKTFKLNGFFNKIKKLGARIKRQAKKARDLLRKGRRKAYALHQRLARLLRQRMLAMRITLKRRLRRLKFFNSRRGQRQRWRRRCAARVACINQAVSEIQNKYQTFWYHDCLRRNPAVSFLATTSDITSKAAALSVGKSSSSSIKPALPADPEKLIPSDVGDDVLVSSDPFDPEESEDEDDDNENQNNQQQEYQQYQQQQQSEESQGGGEEEEEDLLISNADQDEVNEDSSEGSKGPFSFSGSFRANARFGPVHAGASLHVGLGNPFGQSRQQLERNAYLDMRYYAARLRGLIRSAPRPPLIEAQRVAEEDAKHVRFCLAGAFGHQSPDDDRYKKLREARKAALKKFLAQVHRRTQKKFVKFLRFFMPHYMRATPTGFVQKARLDTYQRQWDRDHRRSFLPQEKGKDPEPGLSEAEPPGEKPSEGVLGIVHAGKIDPSLSRHK